MKLLIVIVSVIALSIVINVLCDLEEEAKEQTKLLREMLKIMNE